jgi:hypothetical protein
MIMIKLYIANFPTADGSGVADFPARSAPADC